MHSTQHDDMRRLHNKWQEHSRRTQVNCVVPWQRHVTLQLVHQMITDVKMSETGFMQFCLIRLSTRAQYSSSIRRYVRTAGYDVKTCMIHRLTVYIYNSHPLTLIFLALILFEKWRWWFEFRGWFLFIFSLSLFMPRSTHYLPYVPRKGCYNLACILAGKPTHYLAGNWDHWRGRLGSVCSYVSTLTILVVDWFSEETVRRCHSILLLENRW